MPSANSPEVVNSQPISSPGNNGFGCAAASLHALVAVFSRRRQKKPDVYDSNADAEEVMNFHPVQLKTFSLRELQIATDNFNPENIVGKGGFGIVYKGRLPDGSFVAVKKSIEKHIQIGNSQFQIELQMIAMAVHDHIIRLHGFCVTSTERLLVYPFMANGSVESWLRGRPQTKPPLDWKVRQRIALGAAKGLAYLHDHCIPKIIHRDVKAANILLDDKFEAIVADFGLVKLMDHKVTHITTEARGTPGYIAPECIFKKESSEKTDIYGYGVMLLELISAQRISDLASLAEASSKNEEDLSLMAWLKGLVEDKKLEIIIDEELQGNYVEEEVDKLTQIALLCTQERPKKRPKMSEVVRLLEGDVLAERWEEWKKEEMFRQKFNHSHHPNRDWIVDSVDNLPPDELSGPR